MNVTIFKVNQLGDAICFLPVLQRLFASPQVSRLSVWTTPVAFQILNFSSEISFNEMPLGQFNGAWKNPWRAARIIQVTRKSRPTACLLDSDQGNMAHLAAMLSGSEINMGGMNPNVRLNRFLPHRVGRADGQSYAEWCWDIGKTFASKALGEEWGPLPLAPDLSHLSTGNETKAVDILIHPGASRPYKRWPIDRFAELASRLGKKYRVGIVQARELENFDLPVGVIGVETSSIAELTDSIRGSRLFIGNNSGPMNLAAALRVPTVFISGPSKPMWDPTWRGGVYEVLRRTEMPCIRCDEHFRDSVCHNSSEPLGCMNRWSVEEVYMRCEKMLSLDRHAHSPNF